MFAVDRHGRPVTEVGTAGNVLRFDRGTKLERFGNRLVGMDVREVVFPDDDGGVHTGRVDVAQHFKHTTLRRTGLGGPGGDGQRDHLAGFGPHRFARRHFNVHHQAAIKRDDKTAAATILVVTTHDRGGATFENADDAAFGAVAVTRALDPHDHAVAVDGLIEMDAGNKDAGRAVV